jgi:SAM-dependent methyltransferase
VAAGPQATQVVGRSISETSWEWERGDQPGFSPRQTPVPAAALDRLARSSPHVVLGWFHRYPARFASDVLTSILAEVVTRAHRPVASVLDPFCGTGAVVSASNQLGLDATGVELTTLGVEMGRLRLDPPSNPWDAAAACEQLAQTALVTRYPLDDRLTDWLGTRNARLLAAWLPEVDKIDDVRLRRFATVALSQSLRPSSRWLIGSVKATTDPARMPIPLDQSLRRWARQLARDCVAEQDAHAAVGDVFGAVRQRGKVLHGDARTLPIADASIDAIVTSPPYFVTYDYFDVHRLSYLAFGWPVQRTDQVGAKYGLEPTDRQVDLPPALRFWYQDQFRGECTVLGRALRTYVEDLRTHLAEAARVVAPGGIVAYSVANTVRAGRVFDLAEAFRQLLVEAGFSDVQAVPRHQGGRRILPAGRDVQSGRFARDAGNAGVREYILFATRR